MAMTSNQQSKMQIGYLKRVVLVYAPCNVHSYVYYALIKIEYILTVKIPVNDFRNPVNDLYPHFL